MSSAQNRFKSLKELDASSVKAPLAKQVKIGVLCCAPSRAAEAQAWTETLDHAGLKATLLDSLLDTSAVDVLLVFGSLLDTAAMDSAVAAKTVLVWAPEEESRLEGSKEALVVVQLKEVWVYPQNVTTAQLISVLTRGTKVRVLPQLYSPRSMLESLGAKDVLYDAPTRTSDTGMDVVILSDLVSPSASVLYALAACEITESHSPKTIRSIILALHPKNCNEDVTAAYTKMLVGPKVVSVACESCEIVPYFLARNQLSVFLYHQAEKTEAPQLLWDLAYAGFPVLHNLKTSMAAGVHFEGNDIIATSKLLEVDKVSFGVDYVARTRAALSAVSPTSNAAIDTIRRIVDEWSQVV